MKCSQEQHHSRGVIPTKHLATLSMNSSDGLTISTFRQNAKTSSKSFSDGKRIRDLELRMVHLTSNGASGSASSTLR